MFNRKYKFKIEEREVVDFVRLLGRFGFRFDMSEARLSVDCFGFKPTVTYRTFIVYTSPRKMEKFHETINILANYKIG